MGLSFGILIYFALRYLFVPDHTGRLGFIITHMGPFLKRNLLNIPTAVGPLLPAAIMIFKALNSIKVADKRNLVLVTVFWGCVAVGIAGITTDFSRVAVLLTLPMVCVLTHPSLQPMVFFEQMLTVDYLIPLLCISVVTPMFSWSGADVYLWYTLEGSFQKYQLFHR